VLLVVRVLLGLVVRVLLGLLGLVVLVLVIVLWGHSLLLMILWDCSGFRKK
jgi:hypothetical protein